MQSETGQKSFYYGTNQKNLDVTAVVAQHLSNNGIIHIPRSDSVRCFYFTDAHYDKIKKVTVMVDKKKSMYLIIITMYILTRPPIKCTWASIFLGPS